MVNFKPMEVWNSHKTLNLNIAACIVPGETVNPKTNLSRRLWWPPQLRCRFFQLAARIARKLEPSLGVIIHIWLPDSSPQLFGGNLEKKHGGLKPP